MKLKRLIIQGFKSFKDKTVIQFDEGITGIVGPNGCGKSNIVDALFWVMGEQSAKHLRGNSMQDLIFAGSSKYQPAIWAEVTLVLENTNGKHINVMNTVSRPSEIQLTRKLYKNSETEYRINGEPARLKDIQEVFMDTGAGAKSYSIIAQGEINKLVQAKPEERRTMIEEVAGITKFKLRRRESLKKIEQTELNIGRLSDLKAEVHKNLKNLEKQAEKAERAKTLRAKVQKHDLIVHSHKEFDLLEDYKEIRGKSLNKKVSISEWTNRRTILENDLEEERFRKTEVAERIETLQAEYNNASKELAGLEERIKFLKKSIEEKEEIIEQRTKENDEISKDVEDRKLKIEQLNLDLETLVSTHNENLDFSFLESMMDELKSRLSDKEEEFLDLQKKLAREREFYNEIDQETFKNSSKLEEFAKDLSDINEEIETIEKQYAALTKETVKEKEEISLLLGDISQLEKDLENLKSSDLELRQNREDLEVIVKEKSKALIINEAKIGSLQDMNLLSDQFSSEAKNYLSENTHYSLLGDLLETNKQSEQAIQAFLNEFFDLAVSSNEDFESLISWSKSHEMENLQWVKPIKNLFYEEETIERLKLNGCENVFRLRDEVIIKDNNFGEKVLGLFEGVFVVSNLTLELANKIQTGIDFKGLVSKDGKVIVIKKANSLIIKHVGTSTNGQGIIERNNLLKELISKIEDQKLELASLEEKLALVTGQYFENVTRLEQVKQNLYERQTTLSTKKASVDLRLNNYEASNSRLSILKNRKSDISKNRFEMMENEEVLVKKSSELKDSVKAFELRCVDFQSELNFTREEYQNKRDDLSSKMADAKTYESRLKSLNEQILDIKSQVERGEQKVIANENLLNQYKDEVENSKNSAQELALNISNKVDTLSIQEESLNLIKDELAELLYSMKEREDEVKELTKEINKTEKELVEMELKVQQIIVDEEQTSKNIFEKYQVDLRHVIKSFIGATEEDIEGLKDLTLMFSMETEEGIKDIEKVEYSFDRRYGQALRDSHDKLKNYKNELNRLGEINWQAIEDYDRQKLRYEFLENQETELKLSLTDLHNAISQIDTKCRIRFKEAFQAVNERFEKVFPIIFGGGSARLEITGDFENPECGVDIIAQPPGKKMQNINLMSGGEKALTAVSLIFSIFLVKPSPFCLLDEVDAPLDDANVGRFNELLREMSSESQFILITHNKKTMELNDTLYGVTMQEAGVSKAVSIQLQ